MDQLRRACRRQRACTFTGGEEHPVHVARFRPTPSSTETCRSYFRGQHRRCSSRARIAIATAKAFNAVAKSNEFLEVKAGFFEGEILDPKAVKAVADMPSKEELQASLLATILAAPRQVLSVLQAPARDLLYLLKNYETKLQELEQG